MSETLSINNIDGVEQAEAIANDEAESYAIGNEIADDHEGLLAGKYKDSEELERAYLELQQKMGEQSSEPEDQEEGEYEEPDGDPSYQYEDGESPAVDFLIEANDEFLENGELSEETLEGLANMDSGELVDAYLRMQDAFEDVDQGDDLSDQDINNIYEAVGGEDEYTAMVQWAGDNFSPEEIQAYDQAINSGNLPAINLALQALYYRYTDSMGYDGETLQGKPPTASEGFRSQAELVAAMNDPRYDNDPAYRMDVLRKLDNSQLDF